MCTQIKFCQRISIHGWDITTSGLEKETSAILEFFFRLRLRPYRSNRCAILHQTTEFHPNRTTCGDGMTSLIVKMVSAAAQYYFLFRI